MTTVKVADNTIERHADSGALLFTLIKGQTNWQLWSSICKCGGYDLETSDEYVAIAKADSLTLEKARQEATFYNNIFREMTGSAS